ncbi:ShlB/FhaC/HecB family hemolysin secretion/activation protein [Variovorax sp. KK3]|uniref:ShlB/FhaC/HecB family hemolysin secretion/activation protein n=1 Tax=Variovorax sp. KK3 TaxID=1855728 RepID=UPI00097C0104|nr:POTRA domain-containing protein [Variovorax sp. KK3]
MPHVVVRRGVALGFALAVCATGLHAQAPAGNPLDRLPAPQPIAPTAGQAPRVDVQAPPGPAGDVLQRRFTVRRVDVEGVAALPFADIAGLFAPFAGQEASVAQLVAAAGQGTAAYRDRGFALSFVFLPQQDFADGVVRVVAVEGYIADVRIEGDVGPAEPKLRAMAQALQGERPLRLERFERVTQLLARLPGITMAAEAARPSTTGGATTLVLRARRKPYNVTLGADLRQPRSRAVLSGVLNDPFAPGSELSASTLAGDFRREKLLTLGYTQFVGIDGLALKAAFTRYSGYPDAQNGRGSAIERFNTNRRLEFSGSYPLMLRAASSLTLSGGFYAVDNTDDYRVQASGAQLSEDTRVRALFAQLAYAETRADRSRAASLMLAQGLDGAGALARNRSNVAGLAGPGSARLDFTRLLLEASQRDRYANQWGTGFSFAAQHSPHPLAASERISFGGPRFGRGYAPGDAAGDAGWGIGLELNRMFRMEGNWLKQVEPYLLLEAARTRLHARSVAQGPQKLRSVALGIRLSDAKRYSLDLAVAKPTGDATSTNPNRRARLSVLLAWQLEPQ